MFGQDLTTEQLILLQDRLGSKCGDILDMPEDVRTRSGPKGQVTPEEAGSVTAMFCLLAQAELDRRNHVVE